MWGKSKDADARQKVKCAHHWMIESPTKPTSRGICKLCGAEREFRNFMPYLLAESTVCESPEHLICWTPIGGCETEALEGGREYIPKEEKQSR